MRNAGHLPQRRGLLPTAPIRADFWEGDATKHCSVEKKGFFSEKGGGNSVNQGFGKDFYRKSRFSEEVRAIHRTAGVWKVKTEKLLSSPPSRKSALIPARNLISGMPFRARGSVLQKLNKSLTCKRPDLLQSPGTPEPQKCILKSEKCHFRPPGKRAPKVN